MSLQIIRIYNKYMVITMNKYLIMNSNDINEDENIIEANSLTEALIEYVENSTDGVSIGVNYLKKTIVSLNETKELIEYINALFLDWDDTIVDIYLLGEHIYNSND